MYMWDRGVCVGLWVVIRSTGLATPYPSTHAPLVVEAAVGKAEAPQEVPDVTVVPLQNRVHAEERRPPGGARLHVLALHCAQVCVCAGD